LNKIHSKKIAGKKYRIIAVIPETLLPTFVHQKFWLAGLLTRQTIVAFPVPMIRKKWRVLQLIQK